MVADETGDLVEAVVDGVCGIAVAEVISGVWRAADGVAVARAALSARPVLVAYRLGVRVDLGLRT
jgi:hypothetical protein